MCTHTYTHTHTHPTQFSVTRGHLVMDPPHGEKLPSGIPPTLHPRHRTQQGFHTLPHSDRLKTPGLFTQRPLSLGGQPLSLAPKHWQNIWHFLEYLRLEEGRVKAVVLCADLSSRKIQAHQRDSGNVRQLTGTALPVPGDSHTISGQFSLTFASDKCFPAIYYENEYLQGPLLKSVYVDKAFPSRK